MGHGLIPICILKGIRYGWTIHIGKKLFCGGIFIYISRFRIYGMFILVVWLDKGQLISKGFFGILGIFQKTNEQIRS